MRALLQTWSRMRVRVGRHAALHVSRHSLAIEALALVRREFFPSQATCVLSLDAIPTFSNAPGRIQMRVGVSRCAGRAWGRPRHLFAERRASAFPLHRVPMTSGVD